jgi:hypothetical protein|nr:hypothetical protein [uncultured Prevotella sp.]
MAEQIRVWKSKNLRSTYMLVYRDELTGRLRVTRMDGTKCTNEKSIIKGHESHSGGLWAVCRDMGNDVAEIRAAVDREIAEETAQREREELRLKAEAEAKVKALQEAQEIRAALAGMKDSVCIKPIEVLQRYDLLEEHLEQLKPGEYAVCINYRKKGTVELRTKARTTDHLKVLAKVTKEEKNSKAALHRFAVKVREAYQSGIVIIGKTHALHSFGKRIVDAALCIKESKNTYFSSAAPRRYYDKNTLVYMKLEQIEQNGN